MIPLRAASTFFLTLMFRAVAQEPVTEVQRVVNAASLAGSPDQGAEIVSGQITTIFGRNLAPSIAEAATVPLPSSLAGTSVSVNGRLAPLFYVSPGQINFQAPYPLREAKVAIIVTTATGASSPIEVAVVRDAVGLFTQSADGCGPAVAQTANQAPNIDGTWYPFDWDFTLPLNTPSQSAAPGSYLSVYATGSGPLNFPPQDGWPAATTEPLPRTQVVQGLLFGLSGFRQPFAAGPFSGRAPGLIGVDQVVVRIPDDAPEGCAVPVTLVAGNSLSQPATISISRSGRICQNPPSARFGAIQWTKIVKSADVTSTNSSNETFSAAFASAPENQIRPLDQLKPGTCQCGGVLLKRGPRCKAVEPSGLDAGTLNIAGLPTGPIAVDLSDEGYSATLPPGSIQGGPVSVTGAGGSDLGEFQTTLSFPPSIQVTTRLSAGTVFSQNQPFRVTWTNGSADTVVRMRLIHPLPGGLDLYCDCTALASDGAVTLPTRPIGSSFGTSDLLPLPAGDHRLEITARPLQPETFSAPGLTQPATHVWQYEYHFDNLKFTSLPQ